MNESAMKKFMRLFLPHKQERTNSANQHPQCIIIWSLVVSNSFTS